MNEDLPNEIQPVNEEWQAPPLPEEIRKTEEQPQMSEVGTLGGIFFEPGATFEDLRRKPRFLMAGLIIIILITGFSILFIEKIGFEEISRARLEQSSVYQSASAEGQQQMVKQQSSPLVKYISLGVTPVSWSFIF